jgi:hypothetical protein
MIGRKVVDKQTAIYIARHYDFVFAGESCGSFHYKDGTLRFFDRKRTVVAFITPIQMTTFSPNLLAEHFKQYKQTIDRHKEKYD